MTIIKCKMCGGNLAAEPGVTVAECEYCGTKQTLPKASDETLQNLFNRANNLRLKCEFDKAAQIYEKIVQMDDSEAEAHWGIILCKYGIEYVEDPKTLTRIPTCHRTLFEAVTTDADYLAAIDYSDAAQQSLYEREARAIDRIQKDILNIVKNEKPFDVFICYKETDENSKRTQDSVIANDIYYQLTQEGLKVFYAAITLEDKLGQEYEPYIFAALNSAKVMLVIGTKPQYFSAVWVKNEWSRFLKLMKTDRSKLLIPCYRDMDAYDLPEEFAHLQAQDMSKLGFMQDLIRGIKKIAQADVPATTVVKETVIAAGNANTAPLLKRAFMFLEDGDWNSADEYCEKVLDMDPECAQAYLGKLMAELHVKTQESLKDQAEPFYGKNNYNKAVRFADEELKATLTGYIEHINTRNENERLEGIYTRAKNAMSAANTESAYKEAAHLFESVSEYQDSAALAQVCYEKAEEERITREKHTQEKILILKPLLERSKKASKLIAIGAYHTVAVRSDGTALSTTFRGSADNNFGQCNVGGWRDLIAIAAGEHHTVGLKADGTVVATGDNSCGQCQTYGWRNIVAIAAGDAHTVGLKADGTVVATTIYKSDRNSGQSNLGDWQGIVEISAKAYHTIGIKSDGTVVATGSRAGEMHNFRNPADVSGSLFHTIALNADGTVTAVGTNEAVGDNENGQCDVSEWHDMIAVSPAIRYTAGLKADGTVITTKFKGEEAHYWGQRDVQGWRNIIAIAARTFHTVGLKADGTLVAVGVANSGQCDVRGWKLFNCIDTLEQERQCEEEKRKRRDAGVCQHCGGELKGIFFKKCVSCGKPKDY